METIKRARVQAIVGGLIWGALLFSPIETGIHRQIAWLLLLAVLVIFPLGLSLTQLSPSSHSIPFQVALFLQPFAALIVVVSYFLPKGVLSGTFAIVWLPLTIFAAADGFFRLRARGVRGILDHPAETCLALAPLYLPIGAIWLFMARMGMEPLGFTEPIVSLTAIHFHFAGFAAPILCGMVGRQISQSASQQIVKLTLYRIIALIVMLGPALVAIGITFSPMVEALAGAILAVGYTGLALITLGGVRKVRGVFPRVLLVISSLSAVVTMFAAAGFALRTFNLFPFLSIPQMVAVHGWGNALGFVFCGLVGWGLNQKSATGK